MNKFKYQLYFHCFIVCILVPYPFLFSFQQSIVIFLISSVFRGAVLIRGRSLIQCGYPKVRPLLEGGVYLRPGAYQRIYGNCKTLKTGLNIDSVVNCVILYQNKRKKKVIFSNIGPCFEVVDQSCNPARSMNKLKRLNFLVARCLLVFARCFLFSTFYSLRSARCLSLSARCVLLFARYII